MEFDALGPVDVRIFEPIADNRALRRERGSVTERPELTVNATRPQSSSSMATFTMWVAIRRTCATDTFDRCAARGPERDEAGSHDGSSQLLAANALTGSSRGR
jgi:hypothetical protein